MKGKKKQPQSKLTSNKENGKKTKSNKVQESEVIVDEEDVQSYNKLFHKRSTLINMSKNAFSYLIRFLSLDDHLELVKTNRRIKNLTKVLSQLILKVVDFKNYLKKENITQLKSEIHKNKTFADKITAKWFGDNFSKSEVDHLIQELLCFLSKKELRIYNGMYEDTSYLLDAIIKSPKCPFDTIIVKDHDYDTVYDILIHLVENSKNVTKIVFDQTNLDSPKLKQFLKAIEESKNLQNLEIKWVDQYFNFYRNISYLIECIQNCSIKILTLEVEETLSDIISEALKHNKSVKTLILKREMTSYSFLLKNNTIETLDFNFALGGYLLNQLLDGLDIHAISNTSVSLKSLYVKITSCQSSYTVLSTIINHSSIERLYVTGIKIEENTQVERGNINDNIRIFFDGLNNSTLKYLSLTNFNINSEAFLALLRRISTNSVLEEIDLKDNVLKLNQQEVDRAIEYFERSNTLKVLKLDNNEQIVDFFLNKQTKKLDKFFDGSN